MPSAPGTALSTGPRGQWARGPELTFSSSAFSRATGRALCLCHCRSPRLTPVCPPSLVLSFSSFLHSHTTPVPGSTLRPGDSVVTETGETPARRELTCLGGGRCHTYHTVWGSLKDHSHHACSGFWGRELDLRCAEGKGASSLPAWGVGEGCELSEQMQHKWGSRRERLSISLLFKTGAKGTET